MHQLPNARHTIMFIFNTRNTYTHSAEGLLVLCTDLTNNTELCIYSEAQADRGMVSAVRISVSLQQLTDGTHQKTVFSVNVNRSLWIWLIPDPLVCWIG